MVTERRSFEEGYSANVFIIFSHFMLLIVHVALVFCFAFVLLV